MTNAFTTTTASGAASGGTIVSRASVLLELGLAAADATDSQLSIIDEAIKRAEGAVIRHLRYDPVQRTRTEYYPQLDYAAINRQVVWEANDVVAYARDISAASGSELFLKHIPIRSITSLKIDYGARSGTRSGSFGSGTAKTEGTDFWPNYDFLDSDGNRVCSDGILRSVGLWPQEPGSVQVVYVAGYSADELSGDDTVINAAQIYQACLDEACRRARRAFVMAKKNGIGFVPGIITNENLGDYSYSIDASIAKSLFGYANEVTQETVSLLSSFVNWGYELAP